jgi:hypothetical protein
MIVMVSVCSVEVLETPVRDPRSSEVVVAAVNRTKANGTSTAVMGLVALGKTAKIPVEKMLVAAGVAAQLLARIKTAKAAVAVDPSSHHHQALLPRLRELARKEAEAAEKELEEVEEVEAQARVGVDEDQAEVVEVGTMEAEAQEAEALMVMETPAEGGLVEASLALVLALLALMDLVEEVMVEEVLVIQRSALD